MVAAVVAVTGLVAAGAGTPASAAPCTGLSALLGGCKTTTTTQPAPPPPPPAPAPAPAPGPAPGPTPGLPVLDLLASARQMVDLANMERAVAGLPPLEFRDDAAALAAQHSERMAAEGRIFHNDQLFSAPVRSALAAKTLGENVGYGGSIAQIHAALMGSAGHRANLLNPSFRVAGVGVAKSGSTLYITQVFIEPSGAAPKALPKPPAVKPASTTRPKATRSTAPRPVAAPKAPAPSATAPLSSEVPTTIAEAPPTTDAPPTTEAPASRTILPTATVSPPESGDGGAARTVATVLLLLAAAWGWRLRRRGLATRRA